MNKKLHLIDAIWVGQNIEPRVIELLPAICLKQPGMLITKNYPTELKNAMNMFVHNNFDGDYLEAPLVKCNQWVTFVGKKGKTPSLLKNFRLHKSDIDLLKKLSKKKGISEAQVIREALKKLAWS